jgi:mlo protein
MKKARSQQRIANALKRWQQKAKKNQKRKSNSYSGFQSGPTTPSHGSSPLPLLRGDNTTGDIENPEISPRCYYSHYETSDVQMDPQDNSQSTNQDVQMDPQDNSQSTNQHPISNPVETSNLEIVSCSPYPGWHSKTVSITDTPGTKQLQRQQPT